MNLRELEQLYNKEFENGHLIALQAIYDAGFRDGAEQMNLKEWKIRQALNTDSGTSDPATIARQMLDMGKVFHK